MGIKTNVNVEGDGVAPFYIGLSWKTSLKIWHLSKNLVEYLGRVQFRRKRKHKDLKWKHVQRKSWRLV